MPLVTLHHLLNVFVQLTNKRGFTKKCRKWNTRPVRLKHCGAGIRFHGSNARGGAFGMSVCEEILQNGK
jgi:hypothetical protein